MRRWIVLLLLSATAVAQPLQLDMKVFAERRQAFMSRMKPRSAAIFVSAPACVRNRDVEHEYRQESNFYYLSGFEEPGTILLLVRSPANSRYILFVQERDPRTEAYEEARAGVEGAMAFYTADTALYVDDFERLLFRFVPYDAMLYYTFGINPGVDEIIKRTFILHRSAGDWPVSDPAPLVADMRLIKNEDDFRMGFQRAVDISAQAHVEALKSIHPGMYEYEIQAVFEYVYRRLGSPRNAFPCIIGSGPNSHVLHYSRNTRKMNDGEVVLMDCGAEYGYYAADITRTVPVNGRFSRAQRELYQVVLDAQNAAMKAVRPGLVKSTLDTIMNDVLAHGLLKLRLIKNAGDLRIYTRHGYSHWLGLDVHDVGSYTLEGKSRQLEPGMVFTLEPGLYVHQGVYDAMKRRGYTEEDLARLRPIVDQYMNTGIRIEDDILVTQDGFRHLSASVPREINEIERVMKERGMTDK